MSTLKQVYLSYWKQLKFFIDEKGLDWTFSSLEGKPEAVVRIGTPKYKVCLCLNGANTKTSYYSLSAGFWIPDSKETFELLKSRRAAVEAGMGKAVIWDMKFGRKSCWIWVSVAMNITNEKTWPASFEWFADKAEKIRDVCHDNLA